MHWDIFCRVIDNHGDLGVCWRLSADLAGRGERVRLWVDDASALAWMAPQGCIGVNVLPWKTPLALKGPVVSDVLIEAFGCDIPAEFLMQVPAPPRTWINLEYLSAEPYVERCHGLHSPVMTGPAAGQFKHFFYPGFTRRTGGLLREPGLMTLRENFNGLHWLQSKGLSGPAGALHVSLFCYEPPALGELLRHWLDHPTPTQLLSTHGRATQALEQAIQSNNCIESAPQGDCLLSIRKLPYLTQIDYDSLLWACDLNFVRGEDSLVRALWAGQPLVWQIYPQEDNAHHGKLEAFLDWLEAPMSLRQFHRIWNGVCDGPLPSLELPEWRECVIAARQRLLAQDDLTSQLIRFASKTR